MNFKRPIFISLFLLTSCNDYYEIVINNKLVTDPGIEVEDIKKCLLYNPSGSDDPSFFWGGTGTGGDPFQVCTAAQLNLVASYSATNTHFKVINDIDLNFLETPFNTIQLFSGSSLVGDGNKIKNLVIDDPALVTWGGGFISSAQGAEIKDIVFENATINLPASDAVGLIGDGESVYVSHIQTINLSVTGRGTVGGLVGYLWDAQDGVSCQTSMVSDVLLSGEVIGTGTGIGGLVGSTDGYCNDSGPLAGDIEIQSSSFSGMINSSMSVVGGVVGLGYKTHLLDVNVDATIQGWNAVGGLVGEGGAFRITTSSSSGSVTANAQAGGIVGNSLGVFEIPSSTSSMNITAATHGGRLFGRFSSNLGSTYVGTTSTGSINGDYSGVLIGYEYP